MIFFWKYKKNIFFFFFKSHFMWGLALLNITYMQSARGHRNSPNLPNPKNSYQYGFFVRRGEKFHCYSRLDYAFNWTNKFKLYMCIMFCVRPLLFKNFSTHWWYESYEHIVYTQEYNDSTLSACLIYIKSMGTVAYVCICQCWTLHTHILLSTFVLSSLNILNRSGQSTIRCDKMMVVFLVFIV